MTVENASGGSENSQTAPGGQSSDSISSGNSDQKNQVAYETFSKLLDEKKALAKKHDDLQRQLDDIQKKTLEKENDWKGLFELERKEKETIHNSLLEKESVLKEYGEREITAKKFSAFKEKLGTDIDKRYFSLIDLDEVIINPDTGKVEETSAIVAAKKFAETYPEVVKPRVGSRGAFEGQSGSTTGGAITHEQWLAIKDYREKQRQYSNIIR
jgi:hypothetical protein